MFFIIDELNLKPSAVRYKLMNEIDKLIPEINKEFIFNKDTQCVVICNLLNSKNEPYETFVSRTRGFGDCLRNLKRQIMYYDKYKTNFYQEGKRA